MRLDDPRIDLPRLVHLIEDSFSRKLDLRHYMDRVNGRLAGLIIAGEYEGGAILTWETPPGMPDYGSPEGISRMVPYLDKFAVLKRSQGAGGVADMVFNAMVRTCFPNGVCWRSRRNNPVNKWYFERSRGTWKLHDSNWTMFWTTEGVPENEQTFKDYEGVCRSIEPSWADKQKPAD
jgi:amino-acid N-acetyltransferase